MPVSYSKKVQLNTFNATEILVFAGGKTTVQFLKKCGIGNALNGAEDNVQLERKGSSELMTNVVTVMQILEDFMTRGNSALHCQFVEEM